MASTVPAFGGGGGAGGGVAFRWWWLVLVVVVVAVVGELVTGDQSVKGPETRKFHIYEEKTQNYTDLGRNSPETTGRVRT